ncbi:MAG TPA: hypothetical protein VHD63_26415, partial [Ktedonobacteraceae bacterium]|nr:hypothetical protein [Ktedonobacteraceae bacterium]
SYPTEIIAGPDSNLWFLADSSNGNNRAIASITTAGIVGQTLFSSYPPTSMISGPDGNLWFLDESDQVIGYLNLSGSGYVFLLPQLGTGRDLAGGADGNFWVTNEAPQNQIICFTPSTRIIAFNLPDFGGQPYAITPGPHDSLWFTETSGNLTGEIGRILLKR